MWGGGCVGVCGEREIFYGLGSCDCGGLVSPKSDGEG